MVQANWNKNKYYFVYFGLLQSYEVAQLVGLEYLLKSNSFASII